MANGMGTKGHRGTGAEGQRGCRVVSWDVEWAAGLRFRPYG